MHKVSGGNIRTQLLRWSLLSLVLVPTILVWFVVGSIPFGYHLVISHGSSMEPLLRDGDAILVKQLDVTNVEVGDIVTLSPPGEQLVTHRLIKVQPLSQGGFLLVTNGDALQFAEEWEIGADETVEVLVARVHFIGYALEFLRSTAGITLLITYIVILVAIWLRRRRLSLSSQLGGGSREHQGKQ